MNSATLDAEPKMAKRSAKKAQPPTVKVDPEVKKMLEEIAEATFSTEKAVLSDLLQAELPAKWKAIQPQLAAVRKLKAKSGADRPDDKRSQE